MISCTRLFLLMVQFLQQTLIHNGSTTIAYEDFIRYNRIHEILMHYDEDCHIKTMMIQFRFLVPITISHSCRFIPQNGYECKGIMHHLIETSLNAHNICDELCRFDNLRLLFDKYGHFSHIIVNGEKDAMTCSKNDF